MYRFTFQSGDIQIDILIDEHNEEYCDLHSNLVIFKFINQANSRAVRTILYIPIW